MFWAWERFGWEPFGPKGQIRDRWTLSLLAWKRKINEAQHVGNMLRL